jgi:uncharacterized protein
MFNFTVEPFQPHPLFRHPHTQTILTALILRATKEMAYQRIRLDTPDGDFIDLDFPQLKDVTLPDDAPLVFLLHGMEGQARSGYGTLMYEMVLRQGLRPVGINYRSCSGEMNRTALSYSLGHTADVRFVEEWLHREYPNSLMLMVGVSLGANLLLKYLGEYSAQLDARVIAAAAISPFFKTEKAHRISVAGGASRFYRGRILKQMKAKVRKKAALIHAAGGDVYAALKARTFIEFDAAITARLYGFSNTDDYYHTSASVGYLSQIHTPTLIMRSLDDPFFDIDVPWEVIRDNPNLTPAITDYGGHVGFMEGVPGWNTSFWAQRQATRFFTAALADHAAQQAGRDWAESA